MSGIAVAFLLVILPPALFELAESAVVIAARWYPSLNRFLDQGDHS